MTTELIQARLELFTKYIQELYQREGIEIPEGEDMIEKFRSIHSNPFMKWKDIYPDGHSANAKNAPEGVLPIGFIVIGQYPECHPDADVYIAEAYINPEYRRQHIMTKTIKELVTICGGTYCMFIAAKNDVAKIFWNKTFNDLGYTKYNLSTHPVSQSHANFILHGFKKA